MLFLQYITARPVCYWGSGSIEQIFGVVFKGQEVMVVVEQVMEAKEWEESCIGASTPDEVHSTEVVVGRENETNE